MGHLEETTFCRRILSTINWTLSIIKRLKFSLIPWWRVKTKMRSSEERMLRDPLLPTKWYTLNLCSNQSSTLNAFSESGRIWASLNECGSATATSSSAKIYCISKFKVKTFLSQRHLSISCSGLLRMGSTPSMKSRFCRYQKKLSVHRIGYCISSAFII